MLENRDLKVIINKPVFIENEFKQINNEKRKENITSLITYLKERCLKKELSQVDIMLYKYLKPEFKEIVDKQIVGISIN